MADPTPNAREHALAAELDAKLAEIESRTDAPGEANRKMLAEALASYREEIGGELSDLREAVDNAVQDMLAANRVLPAPNPRHHEAFTSAVNFAKRLRELLARGKGG